MAITYSLNDRVQVTFAQVAAGGDGGDGGSDTASEVLAKLVTVDGSGSGLDADLLDGQHAAAFALAADVTTALAGKLSKVFTGAAADATGAAAFYLDITDAAVSALRWRQSLQTGGLFLGEYDPLHRRGFNWQENGGLRDASYAGWLEQIEAHYKQGSGASGLRSIEPHKTIFILPTTTNIAASHHNGDGTASVRVQSEKLDWSPDGSKNYILEGFNVHQLTVLDVATDTRPQLFDVRAGRATFGDTGANGLEYSFAQGGTATALSLYSTGAALLTVLVDSADGYPKVQLNGAAGVSGWFQNGSNNQRMLFGSATSSIHAECSFDFLGTDFATRGSRASGTKTHALVVQNEASYTAQPYAELSLFPSNAFGTSNRTGPAVRGYGASASTGESGLQFLVFNDTDGRFQAAQIAPAGHLSVTRNVYADRLNAGSTTSPSERIRATTTAGVAGLAVWLAASQTEDALYVRRNDGSQPLHITKDGFLSLNADQSTGHLLFGNLAADASYTTLHVGANATSPSFSNYSLLARDSLIYFNAPGVSGDLRFRANNADRLKVNNDGVEFASRVTQPWIALTDGATITLDASLGNKFTVTLGGNRTLAISNLADGQAIQVAVTQDGTGSRTLSYSGVTPKWTGGAAPTLTTAAGKIDLIGFSRSGSDVIASYLLNH